MKHLRRFENFNQTLTNTSEYPSLEDMKAYVCGCGYNEMEVEEMTYTQVCNAYETCKMESNESRRYRRYESFDMEMTHDMNENPSEEEMMNYLVSNGYNEMDVMEMDAHELAHEYEVCQMEMYEARKYRKRKQAERKAKKAKPDFLDLDKDGDKKETMKKAYADKKAAQGKGAQKDKADAQKKPQSQAQGKLSAAQKKLPPALQKAILDKKK